MVEMRPPEQVMRLSRMGSFHQCRLSFMRQLTRRIAAEGWNIFCNEFNVDQNGVGHAVYTARGPERSYSLVAFAHDLPAEARSDRVIAEAWDATFALFDGVPTTADIERLSQNVPLQEAGRVSETELTLSRANRSVRLWDHVVGRLAKGQQPDQAEIEKVGYLMRTTAVYGSGKFGAADREIYADREELQAPFQAEMLSVYLIRTFVRDLVNHMAKAKGGDQAIELSATLSQLLGIGNSTGLGMAPFLVNHPVLLHNWITAREGAIAKVKAIATPTEDKISVFKSVWVGAKDLVARWQSQHPLQIEKLASLRNDIELIDGQLAQFFGGEFAWNLLMDWAEEKISEEGQELLASLILEPYPEIVDEFALKMSDNSNTFAIDGAMRVQDTMKLLQDSFGWASAVDWQAKDTQARAWYVSEEKLEPRLGERFEEPIAEYEQPLAPARDAAACINDLAEFADDVPISEFLKSNPEHRHTIRRAQLFQHARYGEIRDNTVSATLLPLDMLRAKLSFFGATHFDPRSDRWVRVCMFAGAPYPEELGAETADLWVYPGRAA